VSSLCPMSEVVTHSLGEFPTWCSHCRAQRACRVWSLMLAVVLASGLFMWFAARSALESKREAAEVAVVKHQELKITGGVGGSGTASYPESGVTFKTDGSGNGITLKTTQSASGSACTYNVMSPVTVTHWSVMLRGANVAPDASCPRCDRRLVNANGFSGGIVLRNERGQQFFDGCMECLEDAVAPEGSR